MRYNMYLWSCPWSVALIFGSHATEISEPCQVGNEAALSRTFRVPWGCLSWVYCQGNSSHFLFFMPEFLSFFQLSLLDCLVELPCWIAHEKLLQKIRLFLFFRISLTCFSLTLLFFFSLDKKDTKNRIFLTCFFLSLQPPTTITSNHLPILSAPNTHSNIHNNFESKSGSVK